MTPLLALEGVDTFYGPVQVHFGLTLEVRAGQVVCLLGGNASGKSTTLKVILGLHRPRAGRVLLDGQDITGLPTPAVIRRVAADLERMLELFPRVRERLASRAGTLSGGEQQMVAMARALMGRPRLLCMDEPTMGLSPLYVDRVLELVRTVAATGVTVFMVEQNASLALRIAQYAYVLQAGRIILHGRADALARDPRIRDAYLGGEAELAL